MPYDTPEDKQAIENALKKDAPPDAANYGATPSHGDNPGLLNSLYDSIRNYFKPSASVNETAGQLQAITPEAQQNLAQTPQARAASAPPDMSHVVSNSPGAMQAQGGPSGAGAPPMGAPAQPQQVIPAHFANMASPQAMGQIQAGQAQQMQGLDAESTAHRQQALETSAAKQQMPARLEQFDRQQADIESHQAKLQTHLDEMGAQQYALRHEQIDPRRFFKEKGTFGTIAMALAAGLGGFGAAMTHTQNGALEMINKAIDNDIESQRANIENRRGALRDETELVGQKVRLFGAQAQGIAAAKQQYLVNTSSMLDAIASKYQDPQIAARADQLKGQLLQEAGKLTAQLQRPVAGQVVGGAGQGSQVAGGAGQGMIRVPLGQQAQVIQLPNGQLAHTGDPEGGRKLTEMLARTDLVKDLGGQAIALASDRMSYVPGSSQHKKFQQLLTDLSQTLVVQHEAAKGIGAMRGEEGALAGREVQGARGQLEHQSIVGGLLVPGRQTEAIKNAVLTAEKLRDATLKYSRPQIVQRIGPSAKGDAIEYQMTGQTYAPQSAPGAAAPAPSFKPIGAQ